MMQRFNAGLFTFISGLATSALTVGFTAGLTKLTEFNLYSFVIWFVLPIGSLILGALASSGYYITAVKLNRMATWVLAAQMFASGIASAFAIYGLQYATFGEGYGFWEYTSQMILQSDVMLIDHTVRHLGEISWVSAWLALVSFGGWMFSHLCIYVMLMDKAACTKCRKFLKEIGRNEKNFPRFDDVAAYSNALTGFEPHEREFRDVLKEPRPQEWYDGNYKITEILMACPQCRRQSLVFETRVWQDGKWKFHESYVSRVDVGGEDLRDLFKPA